MKRFPFSSVLLIAALAAGCTEQGLLPVSPAAPISAAGTEARKFSDLAVTTTIEDAGAPDISSDGSGPYINGVQGVRSVLAENAYNGLKWGDWQFDTFGSTARKVGHSFDADDAVQPGDPNSVVPADPPYWGAQTLKSRITVKCTALNKSMLTMTAGASMTCPLRSGTEVPPLPAAAPPG